MRIRGKEKYSQWNIRNKEKKAYLTAETLSRSMVVRLDSVSKVESRLEASFGTWRDYKCLFCRHRHHQAQVFLPDLPPHPWNPSRLNEGFPTTRLYVVSNSRWAEETPPRKDLDSTQVVGAYRTLYVPTSKSTSKISFRCFRATHTRGAILGLSEY